MSTGRRVIRGKKAKGQKKRQEGIGKLVPKGGQNGEQAPQAGCMFWRAGVHAVWLSGLEEWLEAWLETGSRRRRTGRTVCSGG